MTRTRDCPSGKERKITGDYNKRLDPPCREGKEEKEAEEMRSALAG